MAIHVYKITPLFYKTNLFRLLFQNQLLTTMYALLLFAFFVLKCSFIAIFVLMCISLKSSKSVYVQRSFCNGALYWQATYVFK